MSSRLEKIKELITLNKAMEIRSDDFHWLLQRAEAFDHIFEAMSTICIETVEQFAYIKTEVDHEFKDLKD
jgi:hypothetical protein